MPGQAIRSARKTYPAGRGVRCASSDAELFEMRERFAARADPRPAGIAGGGADLAAVDRHDLADMTGAAPDRDRAGDGSALASPFAPARHEIELRARVLADLLARPPAAPGARTAA